VFWINFWLLRRGKRIYLFKEIYNLYTRNVLAVRRKAFRIWVNAALGQIRNRTMVSAHAFTKDLLKTFTSWRLIAMNSLQIDGPVESSDSSEHRFSSRASLTIIENRVTRLEHLIGDIVACINQLAVRHQPQVNDLLDSSLPNTLQNLSQSNCIPSPHARLDFSTSSAFSTADRQHAGHSHYASILLEDGASNGLFSPGGATPEVDLLLRRGLSLHQRSQAIRSRTAPNSPSAPPPPALSPLADAAAEPRSLLTPARSSAPPPPPAPPCWTPPEGHGCSPPDDDSDRLVEISEISSDSSSADFRAAAPPRTLPPAPPPPAADRRARAGRTRRPDPAASLTVPRGGGGSGGERRPDGAADEDGGGGGGGRSGGGGAAAAGANAGELPDGWRRRASRKWGRAFYYHPETGRSQWHPPGPAPAPDRGPP
jgi:hypothetical protein